MIATKEITNKNKYAPIPAIENKASERYAPNGPPRFSMEVESELTDERLGSRGEYETSDIKIYKTEPKQKNAKTFFSVPAERFECSDFLTMIYSCYQYYIEI